jgi:hypothetical protein
MGLRKTTEDPSVLIGLLIKEAFDPGGVGDKAIKAAITQHVADYHKIPTPDITASAKINAPATGSGSLTLTATLTASAPLQVTSVDFFVDGVLLLADASAPYEASWDTTKAVNGPHTVKVTFHTTELGAIDSDPAMVTVANAPAPQPFIDASKAQGTNLNGSKLQTGYGSSGAGYIGSWGQPGEAWSWPLDVSQDGTYTVTVRYQLADVPATRLVNGVLFTFPKTGDVWADGTWADIDIPGVQITASAPGVSFAVPAESPAWSNWLDINGIVKIVRTGAPQG